MDVEAIQRALIARGYDVGEGGADGVWGRDSIAAARRFQADAALDIRFPGTVGPKTLKALGLAGTGEAAAPASSMPVWYAEARRRVGLHEKLNNAALKKYLASDGHTLGDPARLPWCADFVETAIALTLPDERMVPNPYYALNWRAWGRPLKTPALGAILVFKRPGGGHIGFYAGERKDAYRVLGGNQSNRVSETWVEKKRCVAIRWPATAALPTSGRVASSAGGRLSKNEA